MVVGIFSLKMAATCFIFCAFIGLIIEHEIFQESNIVRLLGFFSMSCGALFMMTALMSFIWLS